MVNCPECGADNPEEHVVQFKPGGDFGTKFVCVKCGHVWIVGNPDAWIMYY